MSSVGLCSSRGEQAGAVRDAERGGSCGLSNVLWAVRGTSGEVRVPRSLLGGSYTTRERQTAAKVEGNRDGWQGPKGHWGSAGLAKFGSPPRPPLPAPRANASLVVPAESGSSLRGSPGSAQQPAPAPGRSSEPAWA